MCIRDRIKYGSLPDLELLVAGHHGSKYATSEELLLGTRPELAVISCLLYTSRCV